MTSRDSTAVVRPRVGSAITPNNPKSFVYVLRDDSTYIARELRARLAIPADGAALEREICAVYEVFLEGLYAAFAAAAQPRGPFELHIYSARELETVRNELFIPTQHIVALDPLCEMPGAFHLGLSRWYHPGGWELAGEGFRPGFPRIVDQLTQLGALAGNEPVALIEDDMYTGETLTSTVADLRSAGINVQQVVVGIQICQSDLAIDGVVTTAAVRYALDNKRPLSDQIDLGDPRDYLIGLSGLVILLESHGDQPLLGRVPYVLPFVRPSDRASFPSQSDWELSLTVLRLSQEFYQRLSSRIGEVIRVRHCDPEFVRFTAYHLETDPDEPMVNFVAHLVESADAIAGRFFGLASRADRAM